MRLRSHFLPLVPLVRLTCANVEKTIFLGPEPEPLPVPEQLEQQHLLDVRLSQLPTLTPENPSLRTHVPASFAEPATTWLVLADLEPERRYEVRICWAATQPTSFTLATHPPSTYPQTNSTTKPPQSVSPFPSPSASASSILLLQILATADFFTHDKTLMTSPPDVPVDIILDPFLLNVLPRSLLPTVAYIAAVVPLAWIAARWISRWMDGLARQVREERESKKTQ